MPSSISKARKILRALAHGINPSTHHALPRKSIVNDLQVTHALRMAIAALDLVYSERKRRSRLPAKAGLPWSDHEEQLLRSLYRTPDDIPAIAKQLERTVAGIEARLVRLGLMNADQRTNYDRSSTQQ